MKLFVLALCVCAAMADLRWDKSGQYRLIDTKPLEYRYLEEPISKFRVMGPGDVNYKVIGAPIPEDYPLAYRYWDPVLYPTTEARLAAMAVKTSQPFVYSYKQVNSGL